MLRKGIGEHEGKVYGVPGKSCAEKYGYCDSVVFVQTLEPRADVQMENAGRKEFFAAVCPPFV